MKQLLIQHATKDKNPDKAGWYDTDRGNFFWYAEENGWSCRDDRYSEERPMIWYELFTPTEIISYDEILAIIQSNYNKFTGTNEAELHASEDIADLINLNIFLLIKIYESREEGSSEWKLTKWAIPEIAFTVEFITKFNRRFTGFRANGCWYKFTADKGKDTIPSSDVLEWRYIYYKKPKSFKPREN